MRMMAKTGWGWHSGNVIEPEFGIVWLWFSVAAVEYYEMKGEETNSGNAQKMLSFEFPERNVVNNKFSVHFNNVQNFEWQ